jgi:hypothetical protein
MWIRITFLGDKQFLITPFVTRLLNVGLQELLFGHDDFLFCKVDGLHYEINSYHDPLGKHTHACLFKNGLEAVLLPTLILYR